MTEMSLKNAVIQAGFDRFSFGVILSKPAKDCRQYLDMGIVGHENLPYLEI